MKRIIPIILLLNYCILMIGVHIPYLIYFTGEYIENYDAVIVKVDNSNTLIGDSCYLNALIKRATNNDDKTPPPRIDTSNNYYIFSKNLLSTQIAAVQKFNFKGYMISIKETFIDIDVPPPKMFS